MRRVESDWWTIWYGGPSGAAFKRKSEVVCKDITKKRVIAYKSQGPSN